MLKRSWRGFMPLGFAGGTVLLVVTLHAASALLTASPQQSSTPEQLPPLSYVCPMPEDAEVVEDKPGKCPKCGMELVPVRLDTAWSCPTHPMVMQEAPGKCPIDKRDLVKITASVYFTCRDNADIHELKPGPCADGMNRVKAFERRSHGDHNPRHGGQFFMAADNWHHVEGAYPQAGLFRVYFYNDFTQPVAPNEFSGRAVVLDAADKEVASSPLEPGTVGTALDARISPTPLPVKLKLWMKFRPTDKEHVFDFAFNELSKEPDAAAPVPMPAAPAQSPAASSAASPDMRLMEMVPTNVPDLLSELTKRNEEIRALLGQGALNQVWFAALSAKNLALALQSYDSQLPDHQRVVASNAVKRLVLAAWRVDAYGDLGDKQKLDEAYTVFAAAATEITSVYGSIH